MEQNNSVRFIFWAIFIACLIFLAVKYGQRCSQEHFVPVRVVLPPKRPSTYIGYDEMQNVGADLPQVWPNYNKFSLYSSHVSPGNPRGYPYTNTPYDETMRECSSTCYPESHKGRCLTGCVMKALHQSLAPLSQVKFG